METESANLHSAILETPERAPGPTAPQEEVSRRKERSLILFVTSSYLYYVFLMGIIAYHFVRDHRYGALAFPITVGLIIAYVVFRLWRRPHPPLWLVAAPTVFRTAIILLGQKLLVASLVWNAATLIAIYLLWKIWRQHSLIAEPVAGYRCEERTQAPHDLR